MEDKSIKKQKMKLIKELAHLEKEMEKQVHWVLEMKTWLLKDQDDLKANVAALDPRRLSQKEYLRKRNSYQHQWSINFFGLQEEYIYLKEIYSEFNSKMLDLDILLNPDDEEGNPDPNARREPESIYSLDNKDIVRKNSQLEELHRSIQEALTHFVVSLPAPKQEFMSQQSTIPWLKDLVVIKAHVAEKPIVNAGDKDKEDDTTAVTTGENNTADLKIPEQEEIANLNQGGVNTAPKPTHSPSGESIKSLQIKGKSYQDQEALPKLSITILGSIDVTIRMLMSIPLLTMPRKLRVSRKS